MPDKEVREFQTQNVDFAAFLILEGVKFLGCMNSQQDQRVVILRFSDERNTCSDLERVFLGSEFKKYRDINKWLLGKIHEIKRS